MDSNDIDYDIYFDDAAVRPISPSTEVGGWFCSSNATTSSVNTSRPTMMAMMGGSSGVGGGDTSMGVAGSSAPSPFSNLPSASSDRGRNNCTDFGNYCFWTTPASDTTATKFTATTANQQRQNYQQYQQYQYYQSHHKTNENEKQISLEQSQTSQRVMQEAQDEQGDDDDTDKIEIDDLVSQIAKEMSDLSFKERNTMYEEIHGIVKLEPEDPQMIDNKLIELDAEISRLLIEFNSTIAHSDQQATTTKKSSQKQPYAFTTTKPYEKSIQINPEYAGGKRFKLMYLRNSGFDIKEAAQHLILHFEWKQRLWPHDEMLSGRPLTLSDLDENDMELLESAKLLFLPGFDMAGRTVFVLAEDILNADIFDTVLRIIFFVFSSVIWRNEHQEQQKGIIMVVYTLNWKLLPKEDEGTSPPVDTGNPWSIIKGQYIKRFTTMPKFRKCLPHRFTAYHYCYNSPIIKTLFDFNQKISPKKTRLRFRAHYGSHVEVQYNLMSYGIHPSRLTVDESGKFRTFLVQKFIADQRNYENQVQQGISLSQYDASSFPTTIGVAGSASSRSMEEGQAQKKSLPQSIVSSQKPVVANGIAQQPIIATANKLPNVTLLTVREVDITSNDVLLGRGVPYQSHPGNLHLAKLIEAHAAQHKHGSRFDKVFLTWKILRLIKQDRKGRFLEKISNVDDDSEMWKEVDDNVARTKISYGFRTLVKRKKQLQQQQKNK